MRLDVSILKKSNAFRIFPTKPGVMREREIINLY